MPRRIAQSSGVRRALVARLELESDATLAPIASGAV
jgi:hypothetical protein